MLPAAPLLGLPADAPDGDDAAGRRRAGRAGHVELRQRGLPGAPARHSPRPGRPPRLDVPLLALGLVALAASTACAGGGASGSGGRLKILVTGSRGKVGSATVTALHEAGPPGLACDLGRRCSSARPAPGATGRPTSTNAGDAFAVVRGHDAVIHAAAIPDPQHNRRDRVLEQPDGHLQRPRGGGALGRAAVS